MQASGALLKGYRWSQPRVPLQLAVALSWAQITSKHLSSVWEGSRHLGVDSAMYMGFGWSFELLPSPSEGRASQTWECILNSDSDRCGGVLRVEEESGD